MDFKETDEEVEVRREDQDRINDFGVLHKQLEECVEKRKTIQAELDYLEDAEQEVMLAGDDSGTFQVQLGSTYVKVDEDEFNQILEERRSEYEAQMEELNSKLGDLESRKADLKSTLYSRFGKTINLDD